MTNTVVTAADLPPGSIFEGGYLKVSIKLTPGEAETLLGSLTQYYSMGGALSLRVDTSDDEVYVWAVVEFEGDAGGWLAGLIAETIVRQVAAINAV